MVAANVFYLNNLSLGQPHSLLTIGGGRVVVGDYHIVRVFLKQRTDLFSLQHELH
jgi:hypothetical protein